MKIWLKMKLNCMAIDVLKDIENLICLVKEEQLSFTYVRNQKENFML